MLKMNELIDGVEEKYIPMLKMVNISDFTKCIAQFSGLQLSQINNKVIKDYLTTWAINKYRFFKMLGDKTKLDTPFSYDRLRGDIRAEILNINKEFPVYSYWLEEFSDQTSNKISSSYDLNYSFRNRIQEYFPNYKIVGSTITHFFKGCLKAPDELVTKIAAIFENSKVEATHTISIDPVDMMLASENPYDWQSCYRLETPNDSSHADGCLASVLDTKCLITYIWNREGKLKIYDTYEFKSVRYKRMREWIAISDNMTSIHFNAIYPGKTYEDAFEKSVRNVVETIVAKYIGEDNIWKRDNSGDARRVHGYGYSEFDADSIYICKDSTPEDIEVFDVPIKCPCGCGLELPGSYAMNDCDEEEEEVEYNGEGFICDNFTRKYWCELADDYCEEGNDCCCEENCSECCDWQNAHPRCDLNDDVECETPEKVWIDSGTAFSCAEHCSECPLWEKHHPEAKIEPKEDDTKQPKENPSTDTVTINISGDSSISYSMGDVSTVIRSPIVDEVYKACVQGVWDNNNTATVGNGGN